MTRRCRRTILTRARTVTLSELVAAVLALIRRPRRGPGTWPDWTFGGSASDPARHVVCVRFDPGVLTEAERQAAVRLLWDGFLAELGGVVLTTVRPDLYPAGYCELTVVRSLGFTRDTFPPGGAAGVTQSRCLIPWPYTDRWWRQGAWVAVNSDPLAPMTPERVARACEHELGRVYTESYLNIPERTPEWWAKLRAGVARAAANAVVIRDMSATPPAARSG